MAREAGLAGHHGKLYIKRLRLLPTYRVRRLRHALAVASRPGQQKKQARYYNYLL